MMNKDFNNYFMSENSLSHYGQLISFEKYIEFLDKAKIRFPEETKQINPEVLAEYWDYDESKDEHFLNAEFILSFIKN